MSHSKTKNTLNSPLKRYKSFENNFVATRAGHLILRALAIRASNPQNALAWTSFYSPEALCWASVPIYWIILNKKLCKIDMDYRTYPCISRPPILEPKISFSVGIFLKNFSFTLNFLSDTLWVHEKNHSKLGRKL